MADDFQSHSAGLDNPAANAATVTPNDGTDLANATRALLLDQAGTVTGDMVGVGTNIALSLQPGFNPVRVKRVRSTGTDAITIVAIW